MKVKELIKNLLEENIDDEIFVRIIDDDGHVKFIEVDGICTSKNSAKWQLSYTTTISTTGILYDK